MGPVSSRPRAGGLASSHLKLKPRVKVAFASGTDDLNARLVERMRQLFPELPLSVVSEFPPADTSSKSAFPDSRHTGEPA